MDRVPIAPTTDARAKQCCGPIVIKIGGDGVADEACRTALAGAIAALHGDAPNDIVLVHGGGSLLDEHLGRLGIETTRIDGIRVSPRKDMPEVAAVLAGKVNSMLVAGLIAHDVPAVGMRLSDGKSLEITRSHHAGAVVGEVGVVVGGEAALVRTLLAEGYLPVLSSIGIARDGSLLNVNADDAAMGVARALGARLLVLLTDVAGILDARGELIEQITIEQIKGLIDAGVIAGGMIPKARAAADAARAIGGDTIIASFEDPGALAGLVRGASVGTRVVCPAQSCCDRTKTPTAVSQP